MTKASKMTNTVDELDNTDRRRVLGIIDKFRELGVNEDISLPQVSTLDMVDAVAKKECSSL